MVEDGAESIKTFVEHRTLDHDNVRQQAHVETEKAFFLNVSTF